MLFNVDRIPPYERQLLWIFGQAVQNSHDLTVLQKEIIENRLQEIVNAWVKPQDAP